MKLSLKSRTILSVALFILVFLALILVATFCDLQISQIMTKGILDEGDYFAHDFFGVLLEAVGCTPIYLMIAFVLCVLFWSCLKLWKKKPLNIICAVVCALGVVAACWFALKDSAGYVFEHTLARTGDIEGNLKAVDAFEHSAAMYGIEAFFGLIMAALAIVATMHFKPETLKKLLVFCVATGCAVALANILIMIIKEPVGRMRYRAINSEVGAMLINDGTLKGYTQWFVANGQPTKVLDTFLYKYGVKDAFKSFPSGHTCSAGTAYALIMIPTLFGFKEKNKKGATLACWLVPILYTGLVAISRIMVGAHYMSDVTFGGTLAFVSTVIMWEIFICKGSHFFAVFPKLKKQAAEVGAEETVLEDVAQDETAEQDVQIERINETAEQDVQIERINETAEQDVQIERIDETDGQTFNADGQDLTVENVPDEVKEADSELSDHTLDTDSAEPLQKNGAEAE